MQIGTLSPFYAYGHNITVKEQKVRFWEHEKNRARLMSDEELERKATSILNRLEEEENV